MQYLYLIALLVTLNLNALYFDLKDLSLEQLCNLDYNQLTQIEQLQLSEEESREIRNAWIKKGLNSKLPYRKIFVEQANSLSGCAFSSDSSKIIAYNNEGDVSIVNLVEESVYNLKNPKKYKTKIGNQHIIFYSKDRIYLRNLDDNSVEQLSLPMQLSENIIDVQYDSKSNKILLLTRNYINLAKDFGNSKTITIYDIDSGTYSKIDGDFAEVTSILCFSENYLLYLDTIQPVLMDLKNKKILMRSSLRAIAAQFCSENKLIMNTAGTVSIVTIDMNETDDNDPIQIEDLDFVCRGFIKKAILNPKDGHIALLQENTCLSDKYFRLHDSKDDLNNFLIYKKGNACSFSNDYRFFAAIKYNCIDNKNILYIWDLTLEDLSLTQIIKNLREWVNKRNQHN